MDEVQKGLRKRHPDMHPLLFQRSLEKARSNGELFDILEGVPAEFPLVWDEEARVWRTTDNLLQALLKEKKD